VHELGRADDAERVEEDAVEEEDERRRATEGGVDRQVVLDVLVVARLRVLLRPVLEPHVRADLEELLRDDREEVEEDLRAPKR